MKPFRMIRAFALVAPIAFLAPSALVAAECKADIRVTPKTDQVTDEAITKVFAIEIDTREACAKVYVDAVATERLFNGEEITVTRRGWRKVSGQGITYKVNHRIARDSTLTDWKFTVSSCVVCGTE